MKPVPRRARGSGREWEAGADACGVQLCPAEQWRHLWPNLFCKISSVPARVSVLFWARTCPITNSFHVPPAAFRGLPDGPSEDQAQVSAES